MIVHHEEWEHYGFGISVCVDDDASGVFSAKIIWPLIVDQGLAESGNQRLDETIQSVLKTWLRRKRISMGENKWAKGEVIVHKKIGKDRGYYRFRVKLTTKQAMQLIEGGATVVDWQEQIELSSQPTKVTTR